MRGMILQYDGRLSYEFNFIINCGVDQSNISYPPSFTNFIFKSQRPEFRIF